MSKNKLNNAMAQMFISSKFILYLFIRLSGINGTKNLEFETNAITGLQLSTRN